MAHFAEVDSNYIVTRVLTVPDSQEHRGNEYLSMDLGLGGRWYQTSYNGRIRKNFAGIGYFFDRNRQAFIPPKPFESWVLNEETCRWEAPKPLPKDAYIHPSYGGTGEGIIYNWNESSQNWEEVK